MKLIVLGMNGPFPESDRACSGYLLSAGDSLLQFDFGSGVLSRLTALTAPEELTALFLSHWHYDHTGDLLTLIYRLEAVGMKLKLFAPADESSPVFRIVSSLPCFELCTVKPGDMLELSGDITVRVGEARHPVTAVMYRVEQNGKVFCYTGDTNTLPGLADFCMNADLLLADGLFTDELWTPEKPHLSARLASQLSVDAHAGKLILTHLNPFIDPQTLLAQAREVRKDVLLAVPGMKAVL